MLGMDMPLVRLNSEEIYSTSRECRCHLNWEGVQHLRHGTGSVAMVMTDVFNKNGIMVSGKLAKIVRIFVDMGHIKNQGVIYWPERIGPLIPTLWSGHNFGHEFMTEIVTALLNI